MLAHWRSPGPRPAGRPVLAGGQHCHHPGVMTVPQFLKRAVTLQMRQLQFFTLLRGDFTMSEWEGAGEGWAGCPGSANPS